MLIGGVKQGAESTSVTHISSTFFSPYLWFKKRKSSIVPVMSEWFVNPMKLFTLKLNTLLRISLFEGIIWQKTWPTLFLWKSKKKKPYWRFVQVPALPIGSFVFIFDNAPNVYNLDVGLEM